jgi:aldehyde dehydrogenase (NAD+)
VTVGPGVEDHDVGPLVCETQHGRVSHHLAAARSDDRVRLVIGGRRPDRLDDGWFFEPTILDVSDASSPIATEEVLGPVLTIVPFDDEREAVRIANGDRGRAPRSSSRVWQAGKSDAPASEARRSVDSVVAGRRVR